MNKSVALAITLTAFAAPLAAIIAISGQMTPTA